MVTNSLQEGHCSFALDSVTLNIFALVAKSLIKRGTIFRVTKLRNFKASSL